MDMKQKPSKKHHYLPRNYLKGFTNNDGRFFVYDKSADNIFPTNPDNSFFENHLNTFNYPNGDSSDFLEELYADLENRSWRTLDCFRSLPDKQIRILDKMELFLFLSYLHWRLPSNIEFAEKLSQNLLRENSEIDFFKISDKTGKTLPRAIIEQLRKSAEFAKITKIIAPHVPFFKDEDWVANLANWQSIRPTDQKSWFIVGDNPIITHGHRDHDPINCLKEFIFPLSGQVLLASTNIHIRKSLPPEFIIQYGSAIIERSQRFVACQNEDFLKALITDYQYYVKFGKTNEIILELFEMLKSLE